jgi:hypothetical protein
MPPAALRPATRKRSTRACLALLACVLTVLAATAPAGASAGWPGVPGWAVGGRHATDSRPQAGRRCHGRCCRAHRGGRATACTRAQASPKPSPAPAVQAQADPAPAAIARAPGPGAPAHGTPAADPPFEAAGPAPEESGDPEPEVKAGDSSPEDPSGEDGAGPDEPSEEGSEIPEGPPEESNDSEEGAGEEEPPAPEEEPPPEGPPSASAPSAAEPLRWAPPPLVDPKTIELGDGYTHTTLSPSRDYVVKLPATKKVGGTWLDGGHNVVLIGGEITIPTGTTPGARNDAQRRAIYIRGATGTVHIEGVKIDGSGGGEMDGVDIAAPEATVQLENLRMEGLRGGYSSFHADLVQPWGGVGDLRIDRLSGASNYQGLFLKPDLGPIGSVEISNTDLAASTEGPLDKGGTMLWLTSGTGSCASFPLTLSNVFVAPRPGLSLERAIWPSSSSGLGCEARGAAVATWPDLAVSGDVQEGAPAAGSFVPEGVAGIGYQSPGYSRP